MTSDILLGSDFDLSFFEGDFSVGQDLEQRIYCIVNADKGHYKQYPLLGANIIAQLNGVFGQTELREIQLNLQADGIVTDSITINNGKLVIHADSKN
jgi:myo-inositol-hexaphosphate 3-phosphohydrolase